MEITMTQKTYNFLIQQIGAVFFDIRGIHEIINAIEIKNEASSHLMNFINSKSTNSLMLAKEVARMLVSNLELPICSMNDTVFKLDYSLFEDELQHLYKDTKELSISFSYFENKWFKQFKTNDPFICGQVDKDLISNSILFLAVNESLLKLHSMLKVEINSKDLTIKEVQEIQEKISDNKKWEQ
jgi:hypothetical protein